MKFIPRIKKSMKLNMITRLSVRQIKDTIQLSLLQQSEYLRRFSLTFCEKVSLLVL